MTGSTMLIFVAIIIWNIGQMDAYNGKCTGKTGCELITNDPMKCHNAKDANDNHMDCKWEPEDEYNEAKQAQTNQPSDKGPIIQSFCGQTAKTKKKSKKSKNKKEKKEKSPKIHKRTPNRCTMTALYSIAENYFKRGVKWTPKLWNTGADELEAMFPNKSFHEATGGWFQPELQQYALISYGLNYGSESLPYPPMLIDTVKYGVIPHFDRSALDIETTSPSVRAKVRFDQRKLKKYQDLLEGSEEYYFNAAGVKAAMVGMELMINVFPWRYGTNHAAALFKWKDNWYYVDSNVHEWKSLEQFNKAPGGILMTNKYNGIEINNDAKGSDPDPIFQFGYKADYSLKLGHDLEAIARWIYNKLEVRPQEFNKRKGQTTDCGGATYYRVIVNDAKIKFNTIKEYLEMGKTKGIDVADNNILKKKYAKYEKQHEKSGKAKVINEDNYYDEYYYDKGDIDYMTKFQTDHDLIMELNLLMMVVFIIILCGICGGIFGFMMGDYVNNKQTNVYF